MLRVLPRATVRAAPVREVQVRVLLQQGVPEEALADAQGTLF